MPERMIVVRFVSDCGFYARSEEAAFPEGQALGLVQKGVAVNLGPADEVAAPQIVKPGGIAAALGESADSKRQGARA